MAATWKGYVAGIVSAVSYGLNPLGALYMYQDGMQPASVLFYRFAFASVLLALYMAVRRQSFKLSRPEALLVLSLGVLFAASSLTYYYSFLYLDAGVACTLLFLYPVMVAVIMALCFKETVTATTILAIVLSFAGIYALYGGGAGAKLSHTGFLLIFVSALTYAVYIVVVNRSGVQLSPIKLTCYVFLLCALLTALASLAGGAPVQPLPTPRAWVCAIGLALLPGIVSLVCMTYAVHIIGSTPTAIMGALEPLTGVLVGICVFGEQMTPRLFLGIVLILSAVLLIIAARQLHLGSLLRLHRHHG